MALVRARLAVAVVVTPRRGNLGQLCLRSTPRELWMEEEGAAPALLQTRCLDLARSHSKEAAVGFFPLPHFLDVFVPHKDLIAAGLLLVA